MSPEQTTPDERAILASLRTFDDRTATQLSELTGLWTGALYPALFRLEHAGKIVGQWEDMPPPRRRRYRLAERTHV